MSNKQVERIVSASLEEATGVDLSALETSSVGHSGVFSWLIYTGDLIPPWWSRSRDDYLVRTALENNHLALALYNAITKMVGIPFEIVARDMSNADHVQEAEELTYLYQVTSGFGAGWQVEYSKYLFDYLVTDNGGFMEIIGDGTPDGPIIGKPLSLRHLDSRACTRTNDPRYPVLYQDDNGKLYKLHYTRVIYASQMPSPKREMNGVGLSAVSRCYNVAQTLMDMYVYKMQRLGSRPHNQLLVGQGITGTEIMLAMRRLEEEASNRGLTRYAKTVAIGSKNTDVNIQKIDLTHMEPFQEETSVNLGMFAIAAAFGMDADELWPVSGRSTSRGDANLRRMRSRGRLPSQVTSEITQQFGYKVLPIHLEMRFDFRDDEEDQQKALVKDIRGRNRERDLVSGASTVRTTRVQMLDDGDIERQQFEQMELGDGRLPDGRPIGILFYSEDPVIARHLNFGSINPLDIYFNDADAMLKDIAARKQSVFMEMARTGSSRKESQLRWAHHALDWLEDNYRDVSGRAFPDIPIASRRMRVDRRIDEPVPEPVEEET